MSALKTVQDPGDTQSPLVGRQIRILLVDGLKVIPRKGNQAFPDLAISCSQEIISLNNSSDPDDASYAALSYVWGSTASERFVLCDGELRSVTTNLYNALWHIVVDAETLPIRLWVDSLCINQQDRAEKSHQIALMGEIYRKASNVIAWLGTGSEQTGAELDDFWRWLGDRDDSVPAPSQNATRAGVVFFQRCDWFRRSWTFQEIVLAREAHVKRGHTTVDWDVLAKRISQLGGELCETMANVLKLVKSAKEEPPSFSNLLVCSVGRSATDPRDRVYSLLGMYTGSLSLIVDYNLPTNVVYAQVAILVARELGFLAFFGLLKPQLPDMKFLWDEVYDSNGDFTDTIPGTRMKLRENRLISWIPDWANTPDTWLHSSLKPTIGSHDPLTTNLRCLHESFSMNISLDRDHLKATGVLLGFRMPGWMDNSARPFWFSRFVKEFTSFPGCIKAKAFSSLDMPNVVSGNRFLNPSVYKPNFRDAKDIYLELLEHNEGLCKCDPLDKGNPKKGDDMQARDRLTEEFVKDEEASSTDEKSQMIWCCLLFGSLTPLVVEPIYDRAADELTFSPVAKLSSSDPWTRHVRDLAQGQVRKKLPSSGKSKKLESLDKQDLARLKSDQWRSPEHVSKALKFHISWIPTYLTLSGGLGRMRPAQQESES